MHGALWGYVRGTHTLICPDSTDMVDGVLTGSKTSPRAPLTRRVRVWQFSQVEMSASPTSSQNFIQLTTELKHQLEIMSPDSAGRFYSRQSR